MAQDTVILVDNEGNPVGIEGNPIYIKTASEDE